MRHLHFAYGSSLDAGVMKRRCPGAAALTPAVIDGWKLMERYYADTEKSPGTASTALIPPR